MKCVTPYRIDRRNMLKAIAAASVLGTLSSRIPAVHAFDAVASFKSSDPGASPCSGLTCVSRPIIGTGWHGHTFPGATAPFGLVQLSPDTAGPAGTQVEYDVGHLPLGSLSGLSLSG